MALQNQAYIEGAIVSMPPFFVVKIITFE